MRRPPTQTPPSSLVRMCQAWFSQPWSSLALFCLCFLDKLSLEGKGSGHLGGLEGGVGGKGKAQAVWETLRVVSVHGLAHTRPWAPLVFEVKPPLPQPTPVLPCFFCLILRCGFVARGIALSCMDTFDPILHQQRDAAKTVYQDVELLPFTMWSPVSHSQAKNAFPTSW